jgi:murein hydrolase activator
MLKTSRFFFVLIGCMMFFIVLAQSRRGNLEKKRQLLLQRIKSTQSELSQTAKDKKQTEKNYAQLQENIEQKEAKLTVVEEQIGQNEESLIRSHEVVEALQDDLQQLREDYGTVVRRAFRQRLQHNALAFLVATEDFNRLSQRFFYVRQIDRHRRYQVSLIRATQQSLKDKIDRIEAKIEQKEQVFATIQEQKTVLDEKLSKTEDKLSTLQVSEKKLKRDLKTQERQAKRLDNIIENIIAAEIAERQRLAREAAASIAAYRSKNNQSTTTDSKESKVSRKRKRRKETANNDEIARTNDIELRETPEIQAISNNFRANKGRLLWPVRKGKIVRGFGKQEHPTLRGIFTINNGVDIATETNTEVYSVAEGKVVAIQYIVGSDYLVIVQHGSYYAVYSNLERTYLRNGDKVNFKQIIGRTSNNKVHFEIWSNSSRENPASWLAKG